LMQAANADKAMLAKIAERKPDGPFTGKEGQVIGSPQVDPRLVSYIGGLVRQVGLGNMRILVMHPGDTPSSVADGMGLAGEYHSARSAGAYADENGHTRFFGPGLKD